MKQKYALHEDKAVAAGLIVAYAAGMIIMAMLFGINNGLHKPQALTSKASGIICPDPTFPVEQQAYQISSGQCD